jgi:hypothetical protein
MYSFRYVPCPLPCKKRFSSHRTATMPHFKHQNDKETFVRKMNASDNQGACKMSFSAV